MTHAKKGDGAMHAKPKRTPARQEMPGWTNGLRQLYDEVVDEELPEGLRNLLAQFDDGK
ncbi:MAG TPA: NepR family anti-sigma factor [Qipengyuania sp.]|nr:NepR family anti-sigma factor [Qipengyuania sp.]